MSYEAYCQLTQISLVCMNCTTCVCTIVPTANCVEFARETMELSPVLVNASPGFHIFSSICHLLTWNINLPMYVIHTLSPFAVNSKPHSCVISSLLMKLRPSNTQSIFSPFLVKDIIHKWPEGYIPKAPSTACDIHQLPWCNKLFGYLLFPT